MSDFMLVPTRPAILDLRAVIATIDIIKGSRMRAAIVLNDCQPGRGSVEATTTSEARAALKAFGVPVAPMTIVSRTALSQALIGGLAVSEVEASGKAAREITALWRFVEKETFK